MAKATLKFDLKDEEDRMAHLRAIKSTDMASALYEIFYNTHRRIETDIEVEKYKTPYEVAEAYRDAIIKLLEEHSINLDDLIE